MSASSLSAATSPPPTLPRKLYWSPRMMCLTTKPVIVIMLWMFVVAFVFVGIQYSGSLAVVILESGHFQPLSKLSFIYMIFFYAFMTFATVSYPIGGFLADVYCGRYRVTMTSLQFIWVSVLLLGVGLIFTETIDHLDNMQVKDTLNIIRCIFFGIAFLTVVPGVSGFYSNMIQLSLDQLQDAPSHTLGIFLHWSVWVDLLGKSASSIIIYITIAGCIRDKDDRVSVKSTGYVWTAFVFVVLSVLLILNRFTKGWFFAANIRYNPYKVVVDVLKYVRTHKYPTRHSAMHWTNGEQPSRFDFAKECYGGPFTSSQVEDVKTLGRVVVVLLAVGPVFVLCVPTSYLVFFLFSLHVMGPSHTHCSLKWIFVKSGTLSYLLGLVSLPIITWVVYCVLKNRVPKILKRMEIGIFLFIVGVFSMLVIDLIGHNVTSDSLNTTHCMFLGNYNLGNDKPVPVFSFGFSWYVLIIPNCFSIIAYSLTLVTLLEFISAQAPQPMKGLMFGLFFAIKGVFVFTATVFLIPFSLNVPAIIVSPYVSCGTSYLFLTLVVSLVGLVLFGCVSRRYTYRMRDEEPFSQAVVEEIFERRLQHNTEVRLSENLNIVPASSRESGSTMSVNGSVCRSESDEERVRASEWFVIDREGEMRGDEPERLLSMSHDWYGTFQYNDSEGRAHHL